MIWHILPINDLEEHLEKSTCKCEPKVELLEGGDLMVVHNCYDKRDVIERLLNDN